MLLVVFQMMTFLSKRYLSTWGCKSPHFFMYTHLDLFSGIGGFAPGLQRTGKFKTIAFASMTSSATGYLEKTLGMFPLLRT